MDEERIMKELDLKEIYKQKPSAYLQYVKEGIMYYHVEINNITYQFTIDSKNISDVGSGTFWIEEKASFLMRWIRKAQENKTLIIIKDENSISNT